MAHLSIFAAAFSAAAWLYLLFARGAFWRVRLHSPVKASFARVVAIVPARNEEKFVGRAIASLLSQQDVDIRVVLVDDHSTDATADAARAMVGASDKLMVISGRPLAPGWTGKVWAMLQGVDTAETFSADYFLFTDADIEHGPQNVRRLLAIAQEGNYDLASFMVRLHCESTAEKLLIPAFVFFFFKLYPPAWIADPHRRTAGAAGGCILIRPEALTRAGGLQAIRGEIIDDCSIARTVKLAGGRLWLGLTDSAQSIRPYRSFSEIGRMISRTAFNQLGHSSLMLIAAVVGMLFIYVVPIAALFSSPLAKLLGATALCLMLIAYLPMIRFYKLNALWTVTLPLAALFYTGATIHSAISYWSGRGGGWKGRTQDQPGIPHA